jgi:hypothetical protein
MTNALRFRQTTGIQWGTLRYIAEDYCWATNQEEVFA